MNNNQSNTTYNSLEEIRAQRKAIAQKISANEGEIKTLWQSLFAREKQPLYETPSKHLHRLLSTGVGMFDAALLGWKLYRKFGKGTSLFNFGRRRK